ncbi:sugar ABC transporter permease [Asanoa ishikariensis]|uniref:Carbohydrate ABC transporter membrane protein 1, CUT1 family n=1 Tax=Asanoa ishikariensis TaxID=137265 RepID=A0A1H3L5C5_9ACTN|nr:sugar ABC transporter permease [Asanoa ishikariensis]GIF69518.1 sugar ABC transporter permease [Asanoa ishikariensis]SDY59085.1 carbohydrate ABC transporter membrane protein 1, CUT1 family [Asanoa ishikariensis]
MTIVTTPRREQRAEQAGSPPARRRRRRQTRRAWLGIAYASPTAVMVALFFLTPLVLVGWMSLHRWPLLAPPTLNAPDNFTTIGDNELVRSATWFTIKYTVIITVLLFAVSLGLALLVQHRRRGVGFFRTAFFLPMAVGFASASLLFLGLLSDEIGPVSDLLRSIGLIDGYVSWTSGSANSALGSAVVLVIWRFAGFNMLILLTGLQAIPPEIYEAARVDGASRWQTFRRITLPLLRPTIALVLTLMVTGSLLAFDQFWILTRGGPDNSTTSLVMVIYREAFIRLDLGSAAAISVVLLVVLVVFNVIQLGVLRRRSN